MNASFSLWPDFVSSPTLLWVSALVAIAWSSSHPRGVRNDDRCEAMASGGGDDSREPNPPGDDGGGDACAEVLCVGAVERCRSGRGALAARQRRAVSRGSRFLSPARGLAHVPLTAVGRRVAVAVTEDTTRFIIVAGDG